MTQVKGDPALGYFHPSITDRERAAFESGIALASTYHKSLGLPILGRASFIRMLKRTIEASAMLQPYRKHARVIIKTAGLRGAKRHAYDYYELDSKHLDVSITVEYGSATMTARMRFIEELDYPLMYIEQAESK